MPGGVAHGGGVYRHETVIHVSESLLGPGVRVATDGYRRDLRTSGDTERVKDLER